MCQSQHASAKAHIVTVQYSELLESDDLTAHIAQVKALFTDCAFTPCLSETAYCHREWHVVPCCSIVRLHSGLHARQCFSSRPQAFGPAGLGIIRVAGVPRVELLRRRLLPLAQRFAVRWGPSSTPSASACRLAEQG